MENRGLMGALQSRKTVEALNYTISLPKATYNK
jgi:hypothetical protein